MTPDRAIVKKALADANGNKRKAAMLLGCSRETLYTWCRIHGLDKFAGIRRLTLEQLGTRECLATKADSSGSALKSDVQSGGQKVPTLRLVEQASATDLPVPATVKIPGSLWDRMKIEAIRKKRTVSSLATEAFEAMLTREAKVDKKAKA